MALTQYYGTGKRKTSVARVFLRPGSGEITVNRRTFEDYFTTPSQRAHVMKPLQVADVVGKFNLLITVEGGGVSSQSQAVRHGIARALLHVDADLRPALKEQGLLTRDAREKERMKYGQRGARARFQFSKR
jgi:small subunit ribosomal protein S9